MKPFVFLAIALSLPGPLRAQDDIPLLLPEERQAVDLQTREFTQAITPVLSKAAQSTVRIWSGNRRLAYGTVIGDGTRVLTKWSEIARGSGTLSIDANDAGRNVAMEEDSEDLNPLKVRTATLGGVYEQEDLVVLNIQGDPLPAVKWSREKPVLGSFLAAPQPDGRLAAFGVVSVLERNLRETDLAYLGVIAQEGYAGPGVKIKKVDARSGAGSAGLQPGYVILKVGERPISGLQSLKNALTGVSPGDKISLLVEANGSEKNYEVALGNRPEDAKQFSGERLQIMERMGGAISQVRDSFSHVIQTDMRPEVNQIGGPVVDLKGNVVGITMARADRTRSFIMPSAAIEELLKKEAANPAVAQVRQQERGAAVRVEGSPPPQGKMVPEDALRRHVSEMQHLLEAMDEELGAIDDR